MKLYHGMTNGTKEIFPQGVTPVAYGTFSIDLLIDDSVIVREDVWGGCMIV